MSDIPNDDGDEQERRKVDLSGFRFVLPQHRHRPSMRALTDVTIDGVTHSDVRIMQKAGLTWAQPPRHSMPFESQNEALHWSARVVAEVRKQHPEAVKENRLFRNLGAKSEAWMANKLGFVMWDVDPTLKAAREDYEKSAGARAADNVQPEPKPEAVKPEKKPEVKPARDFYDERIKYGPGAKPLKAANDEPDFWRATIAAGQVAQQRQPPRLSAGRRLQA